MKQPVAFVPHGGGPWPFVDLGMPRAEIDSLTSYLQALPSLPKEKPKALLVVSAHWEAAVPTVMTSEHPPMLYDYGGFPESSYHLKWPAPGNPVLAARVRALLEGAGFKTAEDAHRGYDHGTFVPLMVAWPKADVPVVQLSLKGGLNAKEHLKMGQALAPLRDEGVFILGSGNTFHNLRAFGHPQAREGANGFDAWLRAAVLSTNRDDQLLHWEDAPYARFCHPREEHLIPLMVTAGAAGTDTASVSWNSTFMGLAGSGFNFG